MGSITAPIAISLTPDCMQTKFVVPDTLELRDGKYYCSTPDYQFVNVGATAGAAENQLTLPWLDDSLNQAYNTNYK
jgi:hypothetical protein